MDCGKYHDVCLLLKPYLIAYDFKNLILGCFALPLTFHDPKSVNECYGAITKDHSLGSFSSQSEIMNR